jgi:hypothetical protein
MLAARRVSGSGTYIAVPIRLLLTYTLSRSDGVDSATPDGPNASAVRFDSSQDKSPSKKRKEKTPELHVIDVKTCRFVSCLSDAFSNVDLILGSELPEVCEVMDMRIQAAMMKPIYDLPLPRLKLVSRDTSPDPSSYMLLKEGASHDLEFQ